MDFILNPATLGIGALVLIVLFVVFGAIRRYRIAEPDEAIIVTGRRGKTTVDDAGEEVTDLSGQKVVTGGGIFVLPFVQRSFTLSLRSRRLLFETTAQTEDGITIRAEAVAVVKVGGSEQAIRAAAQRFLSQQDEIESSTQEVLSGSLRGIIGSLNVLTIIRDRKAIAERVLDAASDALEKQGLVIDTLQIQGITDNNGYIDNIGKPEAALVRQRAQIADTEAERAAEEARIAAQQSVLEKNRELAIRQAAVQAETDRAKATADAARPLEEATQRQAVVAQERITAEREAELKEQRLNAEVRKVADAEAYRIKVSSEANAAAQLREAQAEAAAVQARGLAEAEATKARGLAEAASIEARAKALEKEAQSVLAQQALEQLPDIARAYASAYSGIDNLTIISADGPQKIVGDVAANVAGLSQSVKDATGIDLTALINAGAQGTAIGRGLNETA